MLLSDTRSEEQDNNWKLIIWTTVGRKYGKRSIYEPADAGVAEALCQLLMVVSIQYSKDFLAVFQLSA